MEEAEYVCHILGKQFPVKQTQLIPRPVLPATQKAVTGEKALKMCCGLALR